MPVDSGDEMTLQVLLLLVGILLILVSILMLVNVWVNRKNRSLYEEQHVSKLQQTPRYFKIKEIFHKNNTISCVYVLLCTR